MKRLLIFLLLPWPAWAAPTVLDAMVTTVNSNTPSNLTVSSGSDRRLVCFARYNDPTPDLITDFSYGDQAMTLLENHTASANHHYLYELDETGIAAAVDTVFDITYSPGTPNDFRSIFICGTFQDVGQGSITSAEDTVNDDPQTVDIAEAADSLGVAFCSVNHGTGTGDAHAWENSWTEVVEADSDDADITASAATKSLSSGTDTAQCNPTTAGVDVNASYITVLRLDPVDTGGHWFWVD